MYHINFKRVEFTKWLVVLSCCFLLTHLSAATVTWTGANGDWNVGANWSNGVGVGAADDAIIPAGVTVTIPNGFAADATTVDVAAGSTLRINTTGSLTIANAVNTVGFNLAGRCIVRGGLKVVDVSNPILAGNNGTGIYVSGRLTALSSASISLYDLGLDGINISSTGLFYNYGELLTNEIQRYTLLNYRTCRNYGSIEILNNSTTGDDGILNFGKFLNYADGSMVISGGTGAGFANNGIASEFKNWGSLEIADVVESGLHNNNLVYNFAGGFIDISDAGGSGLYNAATATTKNYGEIYSINAGWAGLLNLGDFYSFDLLYISDAVHYGIRNFSGALLQNEYRLHIQGNVFRSLYVDGTVLNEDGGYMILADKIYVQNGTLTNHGILASDYSGIHENIAGTFDNFGAIEDVFDSFGSTVNNQQVISEPIIGTLQNAVPFPNALNVASLSNVNIIGWFTDPLATISAGTYDSVTNEFTPNANAIGFSELRVVTEIASSGIQRSHLVTISGGVLPYVSKGNGHTAQSDTELARISLASNQEIKVYPNPTTGAVNLDCSLCQTAETTIHIYNNLGQLLLNKNYLNGEVINLPNHLPAGIYQLQFLQNGESVANKRIELLR